MPGQGNSEPPGPGTRRSHPVPRGAVTGDAHPTDAGAPVVARRRRAVVSAAVGAGLALLALPGPGMLLAGVVLLQLVLGIGLLHVLRAPGRPAALLVGAGAVAAAGGVTVTGDGSVDGLAAVVGLALVGALLLQLRRGAPRRRVTDSLAGALLVVVLVVAAACLVGLRAAPGGRSTAPVVLAAVAAALLALALPAVVGRRDSPPVARALARPTAGAVLALGAGAASAGLLAAGPGGLGVWPAVLLGLTAGAVAVLADAVVDLAADGAPRPPSRRQRAALDQVAVLLPYALLGPVALVGGRLVAA